MDSHPRVEFLSLKVVLNICVFGETESGSVSEDCVKRRARKRLSRGRSHRARFIRISCIEAKPLKLQNRSEVIGGGCQKQ